MLSTLVNMRANARVLDASLDALSSRMPDKQISQQGARIDSGPLAFSISNLPCLKPPDRSHCAAWCHAAVLDDNDGFWSLTSAVEGDSVILVAMRGSLAQQSLLLQRMCCYRMRMPSDLFDALPQRSLLRHSLMPHPVADSLTTAERIQKIKVWPFRLFLCLSLLCACVGCFRV